MTVLRNGLLVPERYSNRFSSNPHPLNGLQFYADLWNVEQQGVGTLTNGTGVATPTSLGAGANTVTVTTEGTFTIWLPDRHTGTAASGTATVTGSPVSLSGNSNTITVVGTGTITVTCTDQVVDRSVNSALGTVTGATWGSQGRTFASGNFISILAADSAALNFTSGDFTLICRIKPTDLTGNGFLMGRGSFLVDGYYILLVSAGYVEFSTHQAGVRQLTTSANGSILANTGYTLGVTRAGAVGKLYRDGIDFTSSSGTHIDPASANRKFIMGTEADETSSPFIGNYQSAIVYSRALTAQEMLQNHLATKWRL